MTRDEAAALHGPMVARLVNVWTLSPRARAIGVAISEESFAQGLEEVEIFQRELGVLTGYAEADVAKGVMELRELGVLHRRGRQGKPHVFRLLPKAEIVEPQARVDAAAAASVRALVRARNLHRRPGDDPGGQAVHGGLLPTEERLANDLASASASRALAEVQSKPVAGGWVAAVEARMRGADGGNLPGRKVAELAWEESTVGNLPGGKVADGRARTRAGETSTLYDQDDHVDVVGAEELTMTTPARLAPAGRQAMAARALRAVWQVVPKAEFEPWQRRWMERCEAEPELVLGFAEDCQDRTQRGERIGKPGAWIFKSVGKVCAREGRPWR